MEAYTIKRDLLSLILERENGEIITTDDWDIAISFLLRPCEYAIVYNLDNFVETLTSLLNKKLRDKVLSGGKTLIENRLIYYMPSKLFGINYINFYGVRQYEDTEPANATELFKLGKRAIKSFEKMGLTPTKLTSPIAVFADKLDSIPYPRSSGLPESAYPLTESCSKVMTREWRDTYKLGHWNADEITDLDLTSAYPSLVAELPDISEAKFFSSDTMPDKYSWGEMQGTLTITNAISPFICEKVNGYPIGTWEDSITTDELWLINKYNLGSFVMKHGDFFTLPLKYSLPFKQTMINLYNARSNSDEIVQKIAKGISVAVWGKFAERYESRLGDHFNSIYARMTTSRCLVKTASFLYFNNISPISITVDGILAEGKANISTEKKMGLWRSNPPSNALVLSQLYQWLGDKHPNMMVYPEMIATIKNKPNSAIYGDVDFHLLEYSRNFEKLPKNGGELLNNKYMSKPLEVKE